MLALLAALACNPEPSAEDMASLGQVGYRDPLDEGPTSGERGSVRISEIFWSGSVNDEDQWVKDDVFVEIRNESNRPVDVSGWILEVEGGIDRAFVIPTTDRVLEVGEHAFLAAHREFCFPDADWVLEGFTLPFGDPFQITLRDADERLIEPAGSKSSPPFAGGFDGHTSRSMERTELMFGGSSMSPHIWHFYTDAPVEVPNNDRVRANCRTHTLASPGRPNSPDYSGSFAAGSFE